jgi:hypothetical protein
MATEVRTPPYAVQVHRRVRASETRVVFLLAAAGYLAAAWWFWHSHLIPGDANSRVANAYYVLFSRDPHLAAIGFVWNPLPSLILLPVLPLASVLPVLTRDGLLAALTSALFMAGTVALAGDVLRRLGVSRWPRLGLTLLLALHPMILIYAGNGMSESSFLFFLVLSVHALVTWLADRRAESLVALGLSLGLCYGARYEALAPGLAVPLLAAAVTWRHTRSFARARVDAVLVGLPVVVSVGLWALASRIIVGEWFATFSSRYGNSAQVAANQQSIASVTGSTLPARLGYGLHQLLGLEPLVPLLLLAAAVVALRRRDPRVLAPVAVLGAVLGFDNLAFATGSSFGWLRFQITVVLLAAFLAGFLLATPGKWRWLRAGAVLLAVAVALPSAVVTLGAPKLAREESEWFTADGARRTAGLARLNARVAADLDALGLPDGAVLTDSAYAFAIILASRHPRQFVITPDRDFPAVLADPRGHHVRFLLVSANGAADAVRAAYPGTSPDARSWADDAGVVLWSLVPV